jgi:hypothetical protein
MFTKTALMTAPLLALTACASSMTSMPTFSQDGLPASVQVPAGHKVAMETVGVGQITYECRAKKDATGHEWVFVGPDAKLMSRNGQVVGSYYGPPATWESKDDSKLTGVQLAVAPAGPGDIPLQLVKAQPATGLGAMHGVAYSLRGATRGGVAPAMPCDGTQLGAKQIVNYQADYIFWKPV